MHEGAESEQPAPAVRSRSSPLWDLKGLAVLSRSSVYLGSRPVLRRRRSGGEKRPGEARQLLPGAHRGRSWGGQVERGGGGGEDGGGGGTEGVMYPRDGAPAGPEETGAKAGVLGPGLSLLQQVGCWHLNLSSW
ncbi:hypothetical protein INR49_005584, partial [Caranx melampygus]